MCYGLDGEFLAEAKRFTQNEISVIFGLMVLLFNKAITNPEKYAEFVKNRVSAIRSALKVYEFTDHTALMNIFTLDAIRALSSTVSMYPRFKTMLFSMILRHNDIQLNAHLKSRGTN